VFDPVGLVGLEVLIGLGGIVGLVELTEFVGLKESAVELHVAIDANAAQGDCVHTAYLHNTL
jgi:hypothetical protein